MIVHSMKNYFKNFKYIVIPMGILYLAFLVIVLQCAQSFVDVISVLASEITDEIAIALKSFEFNRANIFEIQQYQQLYHQIIDILKKDGGNAIRDIELTIAGGGVFVLLSIIFAWWLTKTWIRKDTLKTKNLFLRKIVVWIVRSLLLFISSFIFVWLITLNGYLIIPIGIVFFLCIALENTITIWFLYFKERKLRYFLKAKYVISSICTYYILALLTFAVIILIGLFNLLLGVIIAIPVLIYGFAMIEASQLDYYNYEIKKK